MKLRRKWIIALLLWLAAASALKVDRNVFAGGTGKECSYIKGIEKESSFAEGQETLIETSEDPFQDTILELYDTSMNTTDEELLETAEELESDFSVLKERGGEEAEKLIRLLKSFEAAKGKYFVGGEELSSYNNEVVRELERQKKYMSDYVVGIGAVTEVIPRVSVISCAKKENTIRLNAQDWITAAYTGEDGSTNASAFGYFYTVTVEKAEDGPWTITGISNTDSNFVWLTDAEEQDQYLEEAGVDIAAGEEELSDGGLEAAGLQDYYAAAYSYDAEKAARYADKWWNSANSSYPSYVSRGVDCANFVSQCLEAGGMKRSGTWKPGKYAWVNVNGQIAYFKNFGSYTKATNSSVMKGCPVYYDWNNNRSYDHAVICVGKNSSGTPIIDSHTSARYHAAYKYRSAYSIMTIQLNGVREEKKEATQNGWVKEGNSWYYYANDAKKTGWVNAGGQRYYLNNDGVMQTGWQKIDGNWYDFDSKGAMMVGWQKNGDCWYYLNGSGVMQTGWQKISGRWYYLNGSGVMQTGWQKISGRWYYLNGSGVMQTGWQKIGDRWYFLDRNGVMQTGWRKINGRWYYFGSGGAMEDNMQVSGDCAYSEGTQKMKDSVHHRLRTYRVKR